MFVLVNKTESDKAHLHNQTPRKQAGFLPGRGTKKQIMDVPIREVYDFNMCCSVVFQKLCQSLKLYKILLEITIIYHLEFR